MKGALIVFEGGEGSGKTSHSLLVAEKLRAQGFDVLHTKEPGGSEVGMKIRQLILDEQPEPIGSRTELLLFLADRAHHVEHVLKPAIAAGKIVICDRFSGSTFAYQIGGRELPEPEMIIAMDAYARDGLKPDLVLFLDIEVEEGLRRRHEEGAAEVNRLDKETIEFHNRVREYFINLFKGDTHAHVWNTAGPKDENERGIYDVVLKELKDKGYDY
jgi:dTMP kinase